MGETVISGYTDNPDLRIRVANGGIRVSGLSVNLDITVHSYMFILDFDDTLFDTHAFKQRRLLALKALGVSEELFWQTYKEARTTADGQFVYSNHRHAQVLATQGFSEQAAMKALDETTHPHALRQLVPSDAEDFLQSITPKYRPLILLSLGNPGMQEIKVKGSGLEPFFDRVFMVDRTKKDILADLFRYEKKTCWFLNDKVEETKELCAAFPQLRPILKVSPNFDRKEYEESRFPYFVTFPEITAYVKQS